MRFLLGLALWALCDARRTKMPKVVISTDTPGGECPSDKDNGGCCIDCEYNRYCRSSGGCHSAEQPGCEVDLCPAPVLEELPLSPSPTLEVSTDETPDAIDVLLDAVDLPAEFPGGIAQILAEAVATRNELEELSEETSTPSPTPALTPTLADSLEEIPNGIDQLLAEAVATRNELEEEVQEGSATPTPTPSPTPSPEAGPQLEMLTPSPSPEAGPSPSPAPEEMIDAIADLR